MFGWFNRRKSKDNLKERLKLVLSYDRAKLTPGKMEELKSELLELIGKYFPAESQEYDVRFEQQGDRMVLVANLPMKGSDAKVERGTGAASRPAPTSTPPAKGERPKGGAPKGDGNGDRRTP